MFINIYISSKNYNSIIFFLNFFSNRIFAKKLNLVISKQIFTNKTQTSIFTVLKSPHVNKTAQEHFKQCLYTKQFKIQCSQNFLFLILMKTLSYYLFSDINFKIELLIQKIKIKQNMKNKINPDNFCKLNNKLNLQIYIKLLNNYGKLILINKTKSIFKTRLKI